MAGFQFCPLCAARLEPKPADPDRGRPACPQGHFIHFDNPAATVQGWIERDGEFLILKRNEEPFAGRWDLPGGFVEMGESPKEAVVREVREETGLTVVPTGLIGAYTSEYGTAGRHTIDIAYLCRPDVGDFVLDRDEKSDAMWVSLDDMPELAFAGERQALNELRERR